MDKTPEAYSKLKEFTATQKYISIKQINNYLSELGYSYSRETIQKYLQKLKKEEVIYSAGRGYYSTIRNTFAVDSKDYSKLINSIKEKYPLLEYSLWSTKMLASQFHHTQNQFYNFVYAESDYLQSIRDYLNSAGYDVILNPGINDINKNIFLKDGVIVLRPYIERGKSNNNIASLEKILVDLYMESKKLDFVDISEFNRIFENSISSFRIDISNLLDYAQRRKNRKEFENLFQNALMLLLNNK